jgi:hypothetical protein
MAGSHPLPERGPRFEALWLDDLRRAAGPQPSWLWHGYLAAGNVTLLTSEWKSGKTTLLSLLLGRMQGGGTLAGLGVSPGRAAVVSEEGAAHWLRRSERHAFAGHVCWLCRPFRGKPSLPEWLALLDQLAELRLRHGLSLVALDPLAAFLPGRNENAAGEVLEALLPLQRLTETGLAVLVLHHPRKGEPAPGQAARGSGALSGYVDILVEMQRWERRDPTDRRRVLRGYSRHEETPRSLVIELNAEGTEYVALGDLEATEFLGSWPALQTVLGDARRKLTREEILGQWPTEQRRPDGVTLWRWLERATAEGRVLRDGQGRKGRPYRYWLPGQEEKWRADPFAVQESPEVEEFLRQQEEAQEWLRRMMGEE